MPRVLPKPKTSEAHPLKHWAMIVFESLGVGALTIMLVFAALLVMVGAYVQIVWPLTDWSLVEVNLDPYRSTISAAFFLLFTAASALGFWFISGAAWKNQKANPSAGRVAPKSRISSLPR